MPFDPAGIPNLAFWFEPSKGGNYQDSAGTATPAVANNDPVGYLPDLSGNGYHATQATAGARTSLLTAGINGIAALSFAGANFMTLGNPTGLLGLHSTGVTRIYAIEPAAAPLYNVLLNKGGSDDRKFSDMIFGGYFQRFQSCSGAGAGGAIAVGTKYVITYRYTQYVGTFGYEEVFVNGLRVAARGANMSADSSGDWTLGSFSGGGLYGTFRLGLLACYGRAIAEAERAQLEAYAGLRYGIAVGGRPPLPPSTLNVVLVGNSIFRGAATHGGRDTANIVGTTIKAPANHYNFSVDGTTTPEIAANSAVREDQALSPALPAIVCFFEGTNQIAANVTAADALTATFGYATAQRALGRRTIVCTIPSRGTLLSGGQTIAGFEASRAAYNQSIRDNAVTYDYRLVDIGYNGSVTVNGVTADCSVLGAPTAYSNTVYFSDGTHITYQGHAVMGRLIAAAIDAEISGLSTATASLGATAPAGWIDAASLAADAGTEVASAVWAAAPPGTPLADIAAAVRDVANAAPAAGSLGAAVNAAGGTGAGGLTADDVWTHAGRSLAVAPPTVAQIWAAAPAGTPLADIVAAFEAVDDIGIASAVADTTPAVAAFDGATALSAVDGFYVGCILAPTGGVLKGLARKVTSYTGATRTFGFAEPWPVAPANADPLLLFGRIN